MTDEGLYSQRQGLHSSAYDLPALRELVKLLIDDLRSKDYLYELQGHRCMISGGQSLAPKGGDVKALILREVNRSNVWPPKEHAATWSADAIFDLLEFLARHVSVPVKPGSGSHMVGFAPCAHYQQFEREPAVEYFVREANKILNRYDVGYRLTAEPRLQIEQLPPQGLGGLLDAKPPQSLSDTNRTKVTNAVRKFRSRLATPSDKTDAIRDLGDVLEFMRPEAKSLMSGDEGEVFNLLNNFGIRHHREGQKTDYNPIWHDAIFYHLLNLIHTLSKLIEGTTIPGTSA